MKNRSNNKYQSIAERISVHRTIAPKQGINHNKQGLRASGLSLLPLALRPLLLVSVFITIFIFQTANVSATSLTLTIPSGISLKVKPEDNATFNKSEESTLSVKSDANFGYTLSIKSKNTNNDLVNGESKIISISSPLSEEDFNNTAENNTWGYLPSKFNSADNTNFQPGPTDSESTIDKTSSPDDSSNNDYKITLAARTDNTLIAGTYKNTFVLTASANTVSYNITYNLNEGSWTGISPQTGTTAETSIKISNITPTRSDYTFEGWCGVPVTNNSSTNPTCPGTKYSVGGNYNISDSTNNLNLYAMWKVANRSYTIIYRSNLNSPSNMPATQSGSIASPYSVSLSNNTPTLTNYSFKGWCTNSTNTATCSGTTYQPGETITISSNGQTINLYAMWGSPNLGSLGNMQSFNCSNKIKNIGEYGTVTDTRDNTEYTIAKLNDGKCWMTENLRIAGKTLTSADSDVSKNFALPASDEDSHYYDVHIHNTYGGYYNWATSTAGTSQDLNVQGTGMFNAAGSICPKGWKMPTYNDYNTLIDATGKGMSLSLSPANFNPVGYYNESRFLRRDPEGVNYSSGWWTSSRDQSYVYMLSVPYFSGGGDAKVGNYSYSNYLWSVRCVSRQ